MAPREPGGRRDRTGRGAPDGQDDARIHDRRWGGVRDIRWIPGPAPGRLDGVLPWPRASKLPAAAGRFMRGRDGGLAGSVSRFRFPPFPGVGGGNVIGKRVLPVFAAEQWRRGFLARAGESGSVGMAVGEGRRGPGRGGSRWRFPPTPGDCGNRQPGTAAHPGAAGRYPLPLPPTPWGSSGNAPLVTRLGGRGRAPTGASRADLPLPAGLVARTGLEPSRHLLAAHS